MTDHIEIQIRKALEAEASAVEPPEDLAERTLAAAGELPDPTVRERLRARWDARRAAGGRVRGYPRWAYAGAAAALVAALFGTGRLVERPIEVASPARERDATALDESSRRGPAVAGGQVTAQSGSATIQNQNNSSADTAGVVAPAPGRPGTFPPQIAENASIEVQVRKDAFRRAWAEANTLASRHGGFVTDSSTEAIRGNFARGTMTVRVPKEKLQQALADFRKLGMPIREQSSGVDVSGQLVDYDARLRAMQAQELQLLELMRQARTVSDTLEVRSRLDSVRQEIESIQAQRASLQGQVDLATVQATIFEPDAAPEDPEPAGRLGNAWQRGLDAAQTLVAGIVVAAMAAGPVVALIAGFWLVARALRRRRATV